MPLFSESVVTAIDLAHGRMPERQRPGLWHVAHAPRWAARRAWLDEEWDHLTDDERSRLRGPLLDHDLFAATASELALVGTLRRQGEPVAADPLMDGLTPDAWTPPTHGRRGVVWEVWTRCVPKDKTGQAREWSALARAVEAVARPLALTVEAVSGEPEPSPPKPGAVAAERARLRDWLLSPRTGAGSTLDVAGVRLRAIGENPAPASLRAKLVVPIVPTHATADFVIEHIRAKVRRYRDLATSRGAALVVVLATEEHGGLDRGLVESALEGRNIISLTFDALAGGVVAEAKVQMRMNEDPPAFDPVLSAVGWIDTLADEPTLTLWRRADATVPLPDRL